MEGYYYIHTPEKSISSLDSPVKAYWICGLKAKLNGSNRIWIKENKFAH